LVLVISKDVIFKVLRLFLVKELTEVYRVIKISILGDLLLIFKVTFLSLMISFKKEVKPNKI
jgi:hypothetical protein